MKLNVLDQSSRKIGSKEHNKFVAGGIDSHEATRLAPPSLLQAFDVQLQSQIETRQKQVETLLRRDLGEPFYAASGFILYQGDCLELMQALRRGELRVDLTVTSPPYNIGKEYEQPMSVEGYTNWCSSWMGELHGITKPTGALWLNVGFFEVPGKGLCVPIPYLLWDKSPFYLLQEIIWKYGAGVLTKSRLSPRNEKWLFYVSNSQNYTFNLDDIRDPNVKYPNQKKNGKFRCHPLGKNPSDVWEFPKVTTGKNRSSKERTDHPAQFPLAVVERIVKASSNAGEVVLDPFSGSGSTGIAAAGLGRVFVGFEIRTDYCELAVERFKEFRQERQQVISQNALF